MITCIEFIDLAEREFFEAKDLLEWDDERRDCLVKHYLNSLSIDHQIEIIIEAVEVINKTPFDDNFTELLRHEIYMYLEPRLRELVSDAFLLGDEED